VTVTAPLEEDDTPWTAIVIVVLLLCAVILLAVWALGTRRGSQETWESLAHQAATGGTAAHDAALGALLAATAAN
jgi:protein-S-isoprenylcysteine O-methyltransferase Ste14